MNKRKERRRKKKKKKTGKFKKATGKRKCADKSPVDEAIVPALCSESVDYIRT